MKRKGEIEAEVEGLEGEWKKLKEAEEITNWRGR